MIERRHLALSAQQVDPLSWFTGTHVPLVFGAINLLYGWTLAFVAWRSHPEPRLQFAGVLICSLACVFVHVRTRPMKRRIGARGGAIAVSIASLGFVLSAIGYSGLTFAIETWWAPFGLGLVLASLAPYLPTRTLLILGLGSIVVTAPFAYWAVSDQVFRWGPVSTIIIIMSPAIAAVIAAATFSYAVVSRMLPLIEKRSETFVSTEGPLDDAAEQAERRRLAELTARAAPFIESVARARKVSDNERALAGQLARHLRDDLVTQSHVSWLDAVADASRLVVIDPDLRASKMRAPQRTALKGLLQAILETPGADSGSLLVELRAGEDGSTAVGISLDMELPEGRRIMHLAPYYLTLSTAVSDLEWNRDRFIKVSFNLPD
ncbi:MAG TPA: hypothetical protein VNT53_08145 [Pseudolysinimonas sp.]|nr:hypothetical protein [Pseudolysinimonas sp.]